jgi:hypothetical protein
VHGRLLHTPHPHSSTLRSHYCPCPRLQVTTDALVGSAGVATVGNVAITAARNLLGLKQQTVEIAVVNKMRGVLRPGRLTLLLGPPGCGKSTFLKVGPAGAGAELHTCTHAAASW